ncbi:CDP-diacylglycerol--serine O-phosphatidyltransferase [Luteitalea sp. TBR-22]|uniref:CDP-diacylglycerol--serine O-phosphatidyltransferase n=1 Tax=Luteitalea sp. TBR-22 TaxID=2802971 RepID=UPI001AF3C55B|nr:CDP-diacylglycerol--serine O-phosphatidyltransferase [Luteitalea sp. TBR-22]BCS33403.1 CDP-diacylglycerol--serine O-phosphatidyltransferase [Luteitalea sp. TBR-22]
MINVLRRRDPEQRRLRRGMYLLPSLFTLANMFCGYACVIYAMRGEFSTAAPFIGIAVVLDMLDGRIARMTGATSDFGREFDSLADVISFGIAPAVLGYTWGLYTFGRLGWAVGFLYLSAAAIRLARFNIQSTTNPDKRYFVGMPSPAAAGVPAATVFWLPQGLPAGWMAALALPLLLVPAALMVSTLRYRSFKTFNLGKRRPANGLMVVAVVIAAVATHPQWALVAIAYTYLVSGFIGWALSRWRPRPADEAMAVATPVVTARQAAGSDAHDA